MFFVLPALIAVLACSNLGLDSLATADKGGGGDTAAALLPVDSSLVGVVFRVSLDDITYAKPQAFSMLENEIAGKQLLFYVNKETATGLDLIAALAGDDGLQNPCDFVQPLPTADWRDDPVFSIDRGDMTIEISNAPVDLMDLALSGQVAEDASGWTGGVLTATVDSRDLVASLPEGFDLCGFIADSGDACHACEDGVEDCLDLQLEDINATAVEMSFDPTEDGSGC